MMQPISIVCLFAAILSGQLISETYADSPLAEGAVLKQEEVEGAGEGPAWSPDGHLYFSGGNAITKFHPDGKSEIFRKPSGGSNGLMFDAKGRLVTCEAANRRVTRTEKDGTVTVLTDTYAGQAYNTPNDLTIDSRGRIYFSDPRYGDRDSMEVRAEGKLVEGVYRIDAPGKVTRIIAHEVDRPNGVLVTPDDKYLYVADNNNNTEGGARKLWRFDLSDDGTVNIDSQKLMFDWEDGRGPDGMVMDAAGRLFVAGGLNKPNPPFETAGLYKGGVYILDSDGELIDFIPIPVDEVTNCTFGGADLKTLYITAGGTLWSVKTSSPGRLPYWRSSQ